MDLAEAWALRYANTRARRMMRGNGSPANPTNRATFGLLNNSSGPSIIVVRDFALSSNSALFWNISYQQITLGGTALTVTPMVPGDAALAGAFTFLDTATVYTQDFSYTAQVGANLPWNHDMPFAVLPPGWSLIFQLSANAASNPRVSLIWEVIAAEELDHVF